jgi:ketosteroid isomerase-like protein
MKKLLLLLLVFVSCARTERDLSFEVKALLKTDEDFSQMSVDKGMKPAFLFYAAEEVIKMREGKLPLFGIKELSKSLENLPDNYIRLQWVPVKADVSGDLGYTFGKWEMRITGKDTIQYGSYVTIWKRQPGGTWKFVLDAGNSTPKP